MTFYYFSIYESNQTFNFLNLVTCTKFKFLFNFLFFFKKFYRWYLISFILVVIVFRAVLIEFKAYPFLNILVVKEIKAFPFLKLTMFKKLINLLIKFNFNF